MDGEKKENIIILNPKWTITPEGDLDVSPSLESFKTAMKYAESFHARIGTIMMLVDVPPRIQHAEKLFITKSEARNKSRRHLGMRHLGQFATGIQNHYLDHLPDFVEVEDIRILTETFVRNIVVNLSEQDRNRLPKCRNTQGCELTNGVQSAGCLEINITSLLFALNPERYQRNRTLFLDNTLQETHLQIFAQPSGNLPGEYVMEAPEHLPIGSWTRTIQK